MSSINKTNIRVAGSGIALPAMEIRSQFIDEQQGYRKDYTVHKTGVQTRFYASSETASDLAVTAINNSFDNSGMSINNIDCLISASGTMEQAIPCNAAKVHAKLKPQHPIPAFDINMTCLSMLMAIDVATSLISLGKYKNILIFSSDIASVGIDWSEINTGGLFGDGAAAIILSCIESDESQTYPTILATRFETHSEGVSYCQIKGGGSLYHPSKIDGDYKKYGKFEMKGKEIYKLTIKVIDAFIERIFSETNLTQNDINWVVPHQASALALKHLQKRLQLSEHKVINIIKNYGNQIATSLPTAFHILLSNNKLKKGDKILFIGTSAGLSLGAMIWEW